MKFKLALSMIIATGTVFFTSCLAKQTATSRSSSMTQRSITISSAHEDSVMFFSVKNTTDKSISIVPPLFAPASNFIVYEVGSERRLNLKGSSVLPRKEELKPGNVKTYQVKVTKVKKDLNYLLKYRPYGFEKDVILECISKPARQ